MTLASGSQISGIDLKFKTSGITITDFRDVLETDTNLNPFEYKQVSENFSSSNPAVSYILTVPYANLPKTVTLYMKIRGTSTGEGKITLDYNNSQVLGGSNNLLQISPNQSAVFDLNLSRSSPDFISPNSLPAVNYPPDSASVNLKLKLFGSKAIPGIKLKAIAVAVGRIGEGKFETRPQGFDLTSNRDGTFSGTVTFPDFKDGNKFSLMIKADKYLLRRICDAIPSETKAGSYHCQTPGLTIRKGENNSFDFSGISLLPGDLGTPDGVLNGYDLSLVRNNIGKNEPENLGLADLNYDGVINIKDFEIIQFIAANTGREADQ